MIAAKPLTVRQFERLADGLGPCELERGEVIPLSPGGMQHSGLSGNIGALLWNWSRATKRGRVFTNEAGLITEQEPATVRGADVAYYSYQRLPKGSEPAGFSPVPPELIVEVLGKGQGWRKMLEKAGEYFRMGVDRVWIVDPKRQTVTILQPDDEPRVLSGRQWISDAEILPGFRCQVCAFFA